MCKNQVHTSPKFPSVSGTLPKDLYSSARHVGIPKSESEPELLYAGGLPPISSSWSQAPWDSRQVILFSNWTLAVIFLMQLPLWREEGSVVYNWYWSSPAQSFSGPSPPRLMTIFYSLRFETAPSRWARSPYLYPPGTGWPGYTPRHWVPFSSPFTTRRATVDVFDPASTRDSRSTKDDPSSN
jgi:hypothetical protein